MRYIWAAISGLYYIIALVVTFLILFPVFFVLWQNPAWHKHVHTLRTFWSRILFTLGIIWTKTTYADDKKPNRKKKYIVVANHASYIDIPVSCLAIPLPLSFIAKAELLKIPLFGNFFKYNDISVDRDNARDGLKALNIAKEKLNSGFSILIYPEGGIKKCAPKLAPFKNGAFKLAIETGADVLPVTFLDNWSRMPKDGRYGIYPGKCRTIIHKSIPTTNLTKEDISTLRKNVHAIIEKDLMDNKAPGYK